MNFYNKNKTYLIQSLLFITTVFTTTLAGAEWTVGQSVFYSEAFSLGDFVEGLYFSIPFLGILTIHEFGHYIAARLYKVKVSLPYYIPFWFQFPLIGTMGAVIRIKEKVKSTKQFFDIGIAGPLAGFVVAIIILFYGFTNLPVPEKIFEIHPDYEQFGLNYDDHVYSYQYQRQQDSIAYVKAFPKSDFKPREEYLNIALGGNLVFLFFETFVVSDKSLLPNKYELMHNPWIFAGYLALFFTALNLIPIGQLDGGHVLYGLIGYRLHKKVSEVLFLAGIFYAGFGLIHPGIPFKDLVWGIPTYLFFLYITFWSLDRKPLDKIFIAVLILAGQFSLAFVFPGEKGYMGWLVFAFVIGRFLGVYHPKARIDQPLDWKRKVLGWIALLVFVTCFTPQPFNIVTLSK